MSSKRDVRDARFGEREPKDATKPAPPPRARGESPLARTSASRSPRGAQETPPDPDEVPSALPAWVNANMIVPTVLAFALGYALSAKYGTHWKMPWERPAANPSAPADAGEFLGEAGDASAVAAAVDAAPAAAPMPLVDAGVALDPNPVVARVRTPTSPDPRGGRFTLAQATEGMTGDGALHADIVTSMGAFDCELLPNEAPVNVANFVGLARGRREFWDPVAGAWTRRPFYNGSIFHRVIPEFMIQGGDQLRSGTGDTGYELPDENVAHHDAAGLLCMANHGPNTGSAQFFITEQAKEHLNGSYSVLGRCTPTDLVRRIAAVPRDDDDRPRQPVYILRVDVRRGAAP